MRDCGDSVRAAGSSYHRPREKKKIEKKRSAIKVRNSRWNARRRTENRSRSGAIKISGTRRRESRVKSASGDRAAIGRGGRRESPSEGDKRNPLNRSIRAESGPGGGVDGLIDEYYESAGPGGATKRFRLALTTTRATAELRLWQRIPRNTRINEVRSSSCQSMIMIILKNFLNKTEIATRHNFPKVMQIDRLAATSRCMPRGSSTITAW